MRIAVNALNLRDTWSSAGRYAYNLFQALGIIDGSNDYLLLSPWLLKDVPETPSTFSWEVTPVGGIGRYSEQVERLLFEQRTFSAAARAQGAKLLHVPYLGAPLRRHHVPIILSALDLHPVRHPDSRHSAQGHAYAGLMASAARHADAVIAATSFAKAEVVELLHVSPQKVHTIPNAPDVRYAKVTEADAARAATRYGLPRRFVMALGGLDVRSNLANLVGAFAAMVHQLGDTELALVTPGDPEELGSSSSYPDWRPLADTFGIAHQVLCMPIDAADYGALCAGAGCVVYVPLYESHGAHALDALSVGAPLVYSDVGALPETVGTAGLRVDPWNVREMSDAMAQVLTSTERARDLRERALAHVKRYTWQRTAAATAGLYADITGTRRD
ncbi:MAG TPA: glycosyltransferase family 1 protein [Ktedonobacterales bacterium]